MENENGWEECIECGEEFDKNIYEDIDDEYDDQYPRCPGCQEKLRIKSQTCEYCDRPATNEAGDIYLCEEHFEDYMEHHPLIDD